MSGPNADRCADRPHLHVGICQRAGYRNGCVDGALTALRLLADEVELWADDDDPSDGRPELAEWIRARADAIEALPGTAAT